MDAMASEYPRLLVDRDVTIFRGNQPEQTRLRAWLDSHDGPMPTYRVELATRCPAREGLTAPCGH